MKKIKDVIRITGLSRRTLQYYDELGIVRAKRTKENYRLYGKEELWKLWRLLIYKEMGFRLDEIACLLEKAEEDTRWMLEERLVHIQEEIVDKDVTGVVSTLEAEYIKLTEEITTYDQYLEKSDKVEAFYSKVNEETEKLCIRLREYSINYAELVVNSNMTNDEKEDVVEDIYDCIYEKAGDEVYDGIYDGVLKDMYDYFYDGIISDGYDYAPYEEWADIYGFWSEVSGAMWDNDIEELKTEIEKFKEEIKKLKQ